MRNQFFNSIVLIVFFFACNQDVSGNKMLDADYAFIGNLPFHNGSISTNTFEIRQENQKVELLLGDAAHGQEINRCDLTLNLKFAAGTEVPNSITLSVDQWIVSIEGVASPFIGFGNTLSKEAIKALKHAEKDLKISISVIYSRSDSERRKPVTSEFISR